jgi:hypothetical protein
MTDKMKNVPQPKSWRLIVEEDVKMTIHAGAGNPCYLSLPVIAARN